MQNTKNTKTETSFTFVLTKSRNSKFAQSRNGVTSAIPQEEPKHFKRCKTQQGYKETYRQNWRNRRDVISNKQTNG